MKSILIILSFLMFAGPSSGAKPALAKKPKLVRLQFSEDFILQQVLLKKNLIYRPDVPRPKLFVESKTELAFFQQAMLPQWGFEPDAFTNAFAVAKNEIFLSDTAAFYRKHKRCIDDSMAHELTHYVQAKYQGFDLNDEWLEFDAIDVQSWFRETHCKL